MFGYVICNKKELSKEELARYRHIYCGLCHMLHEKFGRVERFTLSYDMTFLALFLSALYEPRESEFRFRCPGNIARKRTGSDSPYIEYAADMTILYTYYKLLDDWKDGKKKRALALARRLREAYKEIDRQYPRQSKALKESLKELAKIERASTFHADDAINCSGRMLMELFVFKEDFWSNSLRMFGYELGRFIYLMDAAVDYKKDIRSGSYNPVVIMQKDPKEMEPLLRLILGNATEQFEKLPIVKDDNLIRNILYGGIWLKYNITKAGKEKEKSNDRSLSGTGRVKKRK
ncbi:MAG: hypothetical protein IJL97_05350 [Lachnospiraceae bacterium]|nr:hypothetical protein [Lachnospiraceae bacterium]